MAAGATMSEIAGEPVGLNLYNADGEAVLQVVVPAGNWKSNRRGTRLVFKDRTGELLGGVTRVTLISRDGVNFRLSVSAKNLDLSDSIGPELTMTLEIADEAYVSASGCETNRRATRMRCEQKTR